LQCPQASTCRLNFSKYYRRAIADFTVWNETTYILKCGCFKLQHVKFKLLDCIESLFKQRKTLFQPLLRSVMYAVWLMTISARVERILSHPVFRTVLQLAWYSLTAATNIFTTYKPA